MDKVILEGAAKENHQYHRRYFLPCFWSLFVEPSFIHTCDFFAGLWFDTVGRGHCCTDL